MRLLLQISVLGLGSIAWLCALIATGFSTAAVCAGLLGVLYVEGRLST